MRVIKVHFDGHDYETVFWYGVRDTLQEVKEYLIAEDGYPRDITVEEVVDEEEFW